MSIIDVFNVVKELFFDWRLIAAFVVVIIYLNFVFYVSKYSKKQGFKPKLVIKRKEKAEATPSEGAEETAQASEAASGEAADDEEYV